MDDTQPANHTVELPAEDLLYLQKLEMNRLSFVRELNKPLEVGETALFKIISDTAAEYRTSDDQRLIATVQWDFLATYERIPPEVQWTWAWTLIPPEPGSVPAVVKKIIQESDIPKNFTMHDSIRFKEEILVSYLMARISDMLKYPYIHITTNETGTYSAFGIRKVQWATHAVPVPIPEPEPVPIPAPTE